MQGVPSLKRCLEYLREGDTLLVTKLDRLARSTADLYRIRLQLAEKGVEFKVLDDPSIDTSSRTGKLVMGILALIAEFENDIRRERQMDGITNARERGVRFGRKPVLIAETIHQVRKLRKAGKTVPEIMRQTCLSKASVYRALSAQGRCHLSPGSGVASRLSLGERLDQVAESPSAAELLLVRLSWAYAQTHS